MSAADPLAVGAEIEALLDQLRESSGPDAPADAQRLVQLVMTFYGAGLSRMLEIVGAESAKGDALVHRLAGDPLVGSLLTLHDLHPGSPDAGLIQIMRPSTVTSTGDAPSTEDRCELCATPLTGPHAHLVDVESRRLLCTCTICSGVGGRYRVVPSRYVHLPSMTFTAAEWEPLGIPVGLVFFVVNSHLGRTVASYPGPAGATESLLPLDAWPAMIARHPWLRQLAPDVEALLVRRSGDQYRCYVVPIDACFELVGRIRKAWTGLGGGSLVEQEIDRFFAGVADKAVRNEEVRA